jgi:hypothetical protein
MSSLIIQVQIKSLSLHDRGAMDLQGDDVNIISFSMKYPAEGIPSVNADKVIAATTPLPDDKTYKSDFDASIRENKDTRNSRPKSAIAVTLK